MFAETEFVEYSDRIRGEDLLRSMARIKRQQDRDQSAHDMGVAVAQVFQQRFARVAAFKALREPNLAGAPLHLVGSRMLCFRHRLERPAEFDDIPVTVVPILQQLEIFPDFVNCRHDRAQPSKPYIGPKVAESDIVRLNRNCWRFRGPYGDDGEAPCHSICISSGVSVSCATSDCAASALSMPAIDPV